MTTFHDYIWQICRKHPEVNSESKIKIKNTSLIPTIKESAYDAKCIIQHFLKQTNRQLVWPIKAMLKQSEETWQHWRPHQDALAFTLQIYCG